MQDCSCVFSQQCCRDSAYYTDVFSNVNTYLQNKYKIMQINHKIANLQLKYGLKTLIQSHLWLFWV